MLKIFVSVVALASLVVAQPLETLPIGGQCISYPAGLSPIPCIAGTRCCWMTSVTDTGRCTPVPEGGNCPPRLLGFNSACTDSNGSPLADPCEPQLTCCLGDKTQYPFFPTTPVCTRSELCLPN